MVQLVARAAQTDADANVANVKAAKKENDQFASGRMVDVVGILKWGPSCPTQMMAAKFWVYACEPADL